MDVIKSKEDFSKFIDSVKNEDGYIEPIAFGICKVNISRLNPDETIAASYLVSNWCENTGSAAVFQKIVEEMPENIIYRTSSELVVNVTKGFVDKALAAFNPYRAEAVGKEHLNVQAMNILAGLMVHDDFVDFATEQGIGYRLVMLYNDAPLETMEASYLKLETLSRGKVSIRSLNLNGVFGKLKRLAWVGLTPIELEWLEANEMHLKAINRYPAVDYVDKFPRYLHHIIPAENVRIVDGSKVRFGAQLAKGTTVMAGAAYINFNAGTEGPVMVEGRISSSVIVGYGTDIGGGASILGVLSGTDGNPITVGMDCLLGANSTCGISLGDACIIDAGLAILPGTKVSISLEEIDKIINVNNIILHSIIHDSQIDSFNTYIIKATYLSGLNGVHYRRDSVTGKISAKRSTKEIKLNQDLH